MEKNVMDLYEVGMSRVYLGMSLERFVYNRDREYISSLMFLYSVAIKSLWAMGQKILLIDTPQDEGEGYSELKAAVAELQVRLKEELAKYPIDDNVFTLWIYPLLDTLTDVKMLEEYPVEISSLIENIVEAIYQDMENYYTNDGRRMVGEIVSQCLLDYKSIALRLEEFDKAKSMLGEIMDRFIRYYESLSNR